MKLIYYPPPHTHNTTQHTLTHTDTDHHRHQLHFSRTRGKSTIIDNLCLFICLFIFCARGMFRSLSPSCSSSRSWLALFPPPPPPPCLSFKRHFSLHSYPPPLLLLLRLLAFGFLSPECVKINMLAAVCAPVIPSLSFLSFSLF